MQRSVFAIAAAVMALGLASPHQAKAFDRDRPDVPKGWRGEQTVRHWVYYPRYRHYYLTNGAADPFGYDYRPRGYYPHYNAGYWKSADDVPLRRADFTHPTYYEGWGDQRERWNNPKARAHKARTAPVEHNYK